MKAYVFPGQGSQKKGMGKSLFSAFPELTQKADDILEYSIEELCVQDPNKLLAQTAFTQPALYTINALTWLQIKATEGMPDYFAGHSLGEYNALFAAGVFDFETGLRLVKKRGQLFSKTQSGSMAAIIGATEETIQSFLAEEAYQNLSIANYNSPMQVVITGEKEAIVKAATYFKKVEAKYIILNVSGAFHCQLMMPAAQAFNKFLTDYTFQKPKIPVISNVTAQPYEDQNIVRQHLYTQIISPVRWAESITYLMQQGVMTYKEIGSGNVLSKFILVIEKHFIESPPVVKHKQQGKTVITAHSLGSHEFKAHYHLKYAYVTGAMVHGIASSALVIAIGKAGMLAYYGTGGLALDVIEAEILTIIEALDGKPYGMNLLHTPENLAREEKLIDLYLKYKIINIEASAFLQITPALVKYRLSGLYKNPEGNLIAVNRIMGKVSRPELAEAFFSPAPKRIIDQLLATGKITAQQAKLAEFIPMADSICVEADSGGHTDQGVAYAILPAILTLRSEVINKYAYDKPIFVGAAGGIGTPQAAAAAFILGADFIVTGSINQCTIEAGTSDLVKDMLNQMNVQDTDYAPAGDLFEMGAKIQVLRKGVFFPGRANKLHALYKQNDSLDEIDEKTKTQLETLFFKKRLDDIYNETITYWQQKGNMALIEKAEKNPKYKMALIFKWYFGYSNQAALSGSKADKVNFQIHTGPALGAFNQWVKHTKLEDWRSRHVDEIGLKLMHETAIVLHQRFNDLTNSHS